MQELLGTSVELVAAMYRSPQLLPGGEQSQFVLAGELPKRRADGGEEVTEVFFFPAAAQGRLAGRLGTLPKGTALTVTGPLVYLGDRFTVLVQEAARLPDRVERLKADKKDGIRLLDASCTVRLRGTLASAPVRYGLLEGGHVVNARLGLSVRGKGYRFLEVAAYHDLGEGLLSLSKDDMVTFWGLLQHRRTADGTGWFQRLEVLRLERLHETRAMV